MTWDPAQYARYADERSRPFHDLIARIPHFDVRRAVDLGCGTGELTRTLLDRWPAARIVGLDNSPEMLAKAERLGVAGRLHFAHADIEIWCSEAPPAGEEQLDLILSSAALHWVPDHDRLLPALVRRLAPGGVLAIQMPNNFGDPSHRAIESVARSPRWLERLGDLAKERIRVHPLDWYVRMLLGLGSKVDAWETVYVHILDGVDPVLEWLKGTALRPFVSRLDETDRDEFLRELGGRLRLDYPPFVDTGVTLFPFRRVFVIAKRPD